MSFNNRVEFTSAQTSEKIALVHLQATGRIYEWSLYSGSVYSKSVPYFVYALKQDQVALTQVSNIGSLVDGSFYYDVVNSVVYVYPISGVNPTTVEMISTYQFFYSTLNLALPHDLNIGDAVSYNGRINSNPGYKHKVGIEQALTSLIGTGDLVLENNDAALDEIFDTLVFENQECRVYSWNQDLTHTHAKLIYRGKVTNKSYDGSTITFTIKDQIFDLDQKLPQSVFTADDNVNESTLGKTKRWIYGRVDGLQVQSIDQIGQGYTITGTVSGVSDSQNLVGVGTLFLSELSPNDTLIIGTQEFTIDQIIDDENLVLDDMPDYAFSGASATVIPDVPTTNKNRIFFVTDHACSRLVKTLVRIVQLNRVELNNTDFLNAGDFLEFDTGERIEIKNIAPGNIAVLRQNIVLIPSPSSDVVREPIQNLYIDGKRVLAENFTISNLGAPTNKVTVTLSNDAEFTIARASDLGVELTFTNGSRNITTIENVDLRELLSPRDWIRPSEISYTTYYEILSVSEQSLELRVAFADPTITYDTQAKRPNYVGDDTVVSVNVLGKTEDGEPDGQFIYSAAQAVKDICREVGITNFNDTTFSDAATSSPQLISLALPLTPGNQLTSAKTAIDLLNKSVNGCLTLDANLDLQYRILQNDVPPSPRIIRDSDVINWKVRTTNGKGFRNSVINYRFQDYNIFTKASSNSAATHTNAFVRDYIGTDQTSTLNAYLYNETDAQILSHRYVYFNRLSRSDITINSDLRLEDINIGDVIQLEFDRLYKRFGDKDSRKKLMFVVGLTKNGENITIEATDLNNTFNTSAVITPNDAPDYDMASEDEKLRYGYITDEQGIVNDEETTANTNLIS